MASPETLPSANAVQDERIFRALVDSVTDYAIFLLDPTGIVSTWNAGAQRIKGYHPHEIIGKHFSIFYPEADIRAGKPKMELEVAGKAGRFEDEGWRLRKDGSRFWASVVITAIFAADGTLIGFGKITRDLTERRISEQRYRLLVEGVSDYAIFSLDENGYVTSWNSGAQRIKGYHADEIIGKHFSNFYTPEDRERGLPAKVLQTARDTGHFEGEGWRVRKDGTHFWSSIVVTALHDDDGRITGFSKVTRDVTDRKKLMDELQAHASELEVQVAERERTNAELEAFSYSVSHDLRAPLRAIEGFATALTEDYGDRFDETATDYLNQIKRASTRMSRLVHDLLNYGRLTRIEMVRQPITVGPLFETVVAQSGESPAQVRFDGDMSLEVLAHEPTLQQVLYNLISNAFKFHRPGVPPEVVLSAHIAEPGKVRIAVADNGIGISPQHYDRIFNVFERLHGMEEFPGTGIGLAIVKRSIERMGGEVSVQSNLGEGSTFAIDLPQAPKLEEA
jgi:PAS domain S-box-containing protein